MVSTRRSQTDKSRDYRAGDRVEVVRNNGIAIGALLYKSERRQRSTSPSSTSTVGGGAASSSSTLAEVSKRGSPSTLAHWMVSVEDGTEEDISERMLGRILDGESDESATVPVQQHRESTKSAAAAANLSYGNNMTAAASATTTTTRVSTPPLPAASAKSKSGPAKKAATASNHHNGKASSTTATTRAMTTRAKGVGQPNLLLSGIEHVRLPASNRRGGGSAKHSKLAAGETLGKVTMLTGTLYIYRGPTGRTRRVEFIRSK